MTPAALTVVSYDHRADGLAGDHQVGCQLDVAAADSELLKARQVRHSRCRGERNGQPSPIAGAYPRFGWMRRAPQLRVVPVFGHDHDGVPLGWVDLGWHTVQPAAAWI